MHFVRTEMESNGSDVQNDAGSERDLLIWDGFVVVSESRIDCFPEVLNFGDVLISILFDIINNGSRFVKYIFRP